MALIITTVISVVVAAVMSVVAWRLANDERRRSEARVSALAADIHGEGPSPVHVSDSFFAEEQSRTPGSPLRALTIGMVVVGSAIALVVFASGSPRSSVAAAPPPAAAVPAPLELLTLAHERDGDQLIVRGVVRDAAATNLAHLVAIVSVFDHKGDLAASGQGLVTGARQVVSGVESTFVVTVPGARDVARYRVAFKSNERIVAHLDRREHGGTGELP
jgi:multisubunit Na+/H+ antiporter MnhC subunit